MSAQFVISDSYEEGTDTVSLFFIPSSELRLNRYALIDRKCTAFT